MRAITIQGRTTGGAVRVACLVGALLIGSGLFHLVVFFVDGGPWDGPVSWRKPFTFGVSFGLTLITLAWVSTKIKLTDRGRGVLIGIFTGACVYEVGTITMQAWRGVPSHFNLETPFDAVVSRSLAVGGALLIAIIATLTAAAFRRAPGVDRSMRIAVRTGLLTLDAAMLIGAVMIARGMTLVFGGHQQLAYAVGGWLKPAHAITMHAVLALPLLAWLLSRTDWRADRAQRTMIITIAGYVLLTAVVTVASALGLPLLWPPVIAIGGIGTAAIVAAGVPVLLAVIRRPAGRRFARVPARPDPTPSDPASSRSR